MVPSHGRLRIESADAAFDPVDEQPYYTEMQRISSLVETPSEDSLAARPGRLTRLASRGWRIFATGFAFAEAGLLSLLAAAIVPVLRVLPGDQERAELRAQRAIHWLTRFYLGGLDLLGAFRVRCSDREILQRPGILVVANHPTLLDAWALMSQMPQADCIVKERYYENFFLGGAARGAGFIPNLDGPALIDECVDRLRRGRSLIFFPEGTRSPRTRAGPIHTWCRPHCAALGMRSHSCDTPMQPSYALPRSSLVGRARQHADPDSDRRRSASNQGCRRTGDESGSSCTRTHDPFSRNLREAVGTWLNTNRSTQN